MSDAKVAETPHAFACFVDGGKESVPVSTILNFPDSWHKPLLEGGGWDKNRLYKVFWSPDPEDSPEEMLKRVAEIPIYESGTSMLSPGYYRAAIAAVKDTLEELEDFVDCKDGKRLSVGNLKYKSTSFDEPTVKTRSQKQKQKDSKNIGQPPQSQKAKLKKKKKSSGLNMEAQKLNTSELRSDIASILPQILPQVSTKPYKINKDENANALESRDSKPCQKKVNTDRKTNDLKIHNQKFSNKRKQDQYQSDSSSDEGSTQKKGSQFDPDFSPRKLVRAEQELEIQKNLVAKLSGRNKKLQENVKQSEDNCAKLEEEIKKLRKENETLKEKSAFDGQLTPQTLCETVLSSNSSDDDSRASNSPLDCDMDDSVTVNCTNEEEVKGEEKMNTSLSFENKALKMEDSFDCAQSGQTHEISKVKIESVIKVKGDSFSGKVAEKATIFKEEKEKPLRNAVVNTVLTLPFEVAHLSSDVKELIQNIPAGEKKDLRFIKDLSIAAFGPEVLATSSIFGTAKGGRKKKGEEPMPKIKKPALDKKILESVRGSLIARVRDEIQDDLKDPDLHPRTNLKRFYEAIRGAQKRCRDHEYGQGLKTNDVVIGLLKAD